MKASAKNWSNAPADLLDSAFSELSPTERIEIELPAEVAAHRCRVPRLALGQSLRALVQNSFDASPAGGHVRIVGDCQDAWLTLSIADSGAGMAEDTLRRAGKPFFTTKEPGSGTGLGLFLARRVIERLGGGLRSNRPWALALGP